MAASLHSSSARDAYSDEAARHISPKSPDTMYLMSVSEKAFSLGLTEYIVASKALPVFSAVTYKLATSLHNNTIYQLMVNKQYDMGLMNIDQIH